jgi:aspartyl-tRNA(Asn)/glutamyl-tRNA(Gln) amidotransferase subunit A
MDLLKASAIEISEAVRTKKITAKEVFQYFMKRAKDLNPKLNAFIAFNEDGLKQADMVDQKIARGENPGLLAGVPVAVKDMLCTKGLQTTAGSKILKGFVPPYSSTVVERLEAAGAIVLGKTNQDEFAMGSSNENSAYGIVKNPWNPEYVPGGSSGGSAAAVAARMAPVAIGTDTGGSIRQPANFCNLAGIKPTYGRVSRYGIIAYGSSLDQAGPMANYVKDTALVLQVMSGNDPKDSTSAHVAVPEWTKTVSEDIKGLKIGLPKEYFADGMDEDVKKTVESIVTALKAKGATFVDVSLPHTQYSVSTYYLIATSEASSNLSRYDGIRFGLRENSNNLEELYMNTRGAGFGDEVKRRIMLGTYSLSSGYYDAYYLKACKVRRLLQKDFLDAFTKCDLLLSPVTASPAFRIGERVEDPLKMYLNDIYTTSTNLAGLPGMSVPAGFTKNGLPIGIQLTAKHFEEDKIFKLATTIEGIAGVAERRPEC